MTGTITKLILKEYNKVTRKNYISKNNDGKIVEKSFLEMKGKFLEKLAHDAFSGTNGEDAAENIEKFLNLVEPFNIQNVSGNRLRFRVFPVSLTDAASKWFREEFIGSVTTWKNNDQKGTTFGRIDERVNNNREPCNHRMEDSEKENEVAEIFRIKTGVFNYESPICKAFDEFNYLLKIDPNLLTKDIPRFKTYKQFKNDWIYE
uniref:Uncharacterized protein n=1 Tax=Tanacetum cinerariifolium TaxID=118510 RepID=A0A6L2JHM6_TANCI|nr:hypothetical protein [Tanacetum cinerariifolium]